MPHSPSLTVVPLGSGSAGNCTAVCAGDTLVLVDCGFSARETATRLRAAGMDAARVRAILVTHEHVDHVRGIDVFRRRYAPDCAIHGTAATLTAAGLDRDIGSFAIRVGRPFDVGDVRVVAFRGSHDAADPVGFRIEADCEVFGIATDCGQVGAEAMDALEGCTVLGLEFNHDVTMLERGPYPYHLKRRILSAHGHLSNTDASSVLERLLHPNLRRVIALHRSHTNNTAELAGAALSGTLKRLGHPAQAEVASQGFVSPHAPTGPG